MSGRKVKTLVGLPSVRWCNHSVQCPFIYQFSEMVSLQSKSIYVLQAQRSSAHPRKPSTTAAPKRVLIEQKPLHVSSMNSLNCSLKVWWGKACVKVTTVLDIHCNTFFPLLFSSFFSSPLAFAGTWKWIAVFVQMAQNLKALCGDKVTRSKWRLFITLQRAGRHIHIVYIGGEIQNNLVNHTAMGGKKKGDSAPQRVMCESYWIFSAT